MKDIKLTVTQHNIFLSVHAENALFLRMIWMTLTQKFRIFKNPLKLVNMQLHQKVPLLRVFHWLGHWQQQKIGELLLMWQKQDHENHLESNQRPHFIDNPIKHGEEGNAYTAGWFHACRNVSPSQGIGLVTGDM